MALDKDKKKVLIVGVLGVVVLGVGAFQLLGGSSEAPKPAVTKSAAKADAKTVDPDAEQKKEISKLVASSLPQKDPFEPGTLPDDPTKVQPKTEPEPPKAPTKSPLMRGTRRTGSNYSVPPVSPMVGQLPDPSGSIGSGQPGPNGVGLQPGKPLRQPGEFAYSVNGVVLGNKPAAVFQDDNGNQRLVAVGGSVDGDSRVVSIERGKVTVQHKGKKLTLTMGGGTPVGK